eukprot:COSAG05_NODE_311_length_11636_cov_11.922250_9_plen_66_part_00
MPHTAAIPGHTSPIIYESYTRSLLPYPALTAPATPGSILPRLVLLLLQHSKRHHHVAAQLTRPGN